MKDNIKNGDKLCNTVGVIDFISYGIRVYNYDVSTEDFSVVTSYDAKLGRFERKMLGVSDTFKLGR